MNTQAHKALPGPAIKPEVVDDEYILRRGKRVTPEDVDHVVRKQNLLRRLFGKHGALKGVAERGRTMLSMIQDYARRRYKEVPTYALGAAVFTMLYVLAPADAVPDFIPGIGFLDDAGVVAACLKLLDKELQRYEAWAKVNIDAKARPAK